MKDIVSSCGLNLPNRYNGEKDIALAVIALAIKDFELDPGKELKSAIKFFKHNHHIIYAEAANIDPDMLKEKAMKKLGEIKNDGNNSHNKPAEKKEC